MHPKANKYIKQLKLKKHPEGGYFKEVYRSGEIILPEHLPNDINNHGAFQHQFIFCWKENNFPHFIFYNLTNSGIFMMAALCLCTSLIKKENSLLKDLDEKRIVIFN
jgi:hypothetical protein